LAGKVLGERGGGFPVLAGLALYAIVWAACLAPFAMRGEVPGRWGDDTNALFVPFRAYLIRAIHAGDFPDLAAGAFFGQPMMAFGQPMLLYPTWLAGIVVNPPPVWFFLFDLWIHAILASLGCALFLRRRGAGLAGAAALGWVYPNTTVFLFRATGHWTLLHQAALLPWVLLFWESLDRVRLRREAERKTENGSENPKENLGRDVQATGGFQPGPWRKIGRDWRVAAALSVCAAWMLICRAPHWPYLLIVALLPVEIWRCWRRRKHSSVWRRVLLLAAAAAGAVVLAAPDVIAPLLALRDSLRAALGGAGGAGGAGAPDGANLSANWPLSPVNLIGLISPYFFFGASPGDFSGNWWAGESAVACGRLVWILACMGAFALAVWRREYGGRALLPMVMIAVGLAFGMGGEIRWLHAILGRLPLYDVLRSWGRASVFVVMGLIALAALGAEAAGGGGRGGGGGRAYRGGRAVAAAGALVCLLVAGVLAWMRFQIGQALADENAGVGVGFLASLGWHTQRFARDPGALAAALAAMRGRIAVDLAMYGFLAALLGLLALAKAPRWRRAWIGAILLVAACECLGFQRFVWSARTKLLTPETVPALSRTLSDLRREFAPEPVSVVFSAPELANFGLQMEGIRGLSGADSNMRADYGLWLNRVQGFAPETEQFTTRIEEFPEELLDVTGLRAVVERIPDVQLKSAAPARPAYRILENASRRPYAEVLTLSKENRPASSSAVAMLSWKDGRAELRAAAAGPAMLRIREFPAKGWRVRLDGRAVSWRDERRSIAIDLPAGEHRILLEYIDLPARVCAAVALAAWIALADFAVCALYVRIRARHNALHSDAATAKPQA